MARPLRLSFENAVYHIIARGNRREPIFFDDDDRNIFLGKINDTCLKYSFVCFAYCLMDTHYHLFLRTLLPNISDGMHYLNTAYANWFKARHKIAGVVFQGRYKSRLVDEHSYSINLSAYIHLTPLRAGITKDISAYPWSSYREYVDGESTSVRLDTVLVLRQFDNDRETARRKYEAYVLENLMMENPLKKSFTRIAYGGEEFIRSIKDRAGKIGNLREIPEARALTSNTAEDIIRQVMSQFSVTREEIFRKKRGNFLRHMTLFLLKQFTQMSLREIGELFHMDYAAVSQACKRYEERLRTGEKTDNHEKVR
ncbi:MAG: transposase [Thermodesulfovibrionales bacterium]|nr:transposase [Thermodesulfovibrionales bacterium]